MPSGVAGTGMAVGRLSQAAEILLAALPLAALLLVGVLLFFALLWDHQRRLMIITRGLTPPPRLQAERLALLGAVSLSVGLALVVFFWITRGGGEAMLVGVVPAAAGLGIVVYQRLSSHGPGRHRSGA